MRRHALASSIVAVLMMAVAWMVVAFLQTTRVEEPQERGSAAGGASAQEASSRGQIGSAADAETRPKGGGGRTPAVGTRAARPPGPLGMPPPGEAGVGDGEGEGGEEPDLEPWPLTADGIRGAVKSRIDPIKHCYEQWLKLEPDIAGSVVVTFTVAAGEDGAGEVIDLDLADSELEHPFIEGCVLNVFQDLPFEPPEDGEQVEIKYPLMFDSDGEESPPEE